MCDHGFWFLFIDDHSGIWYFVCMSCRRYYP